ncbi:hypothetical protein [Xenorhabdus hominickii]|uniref:Uncharacterized protein n=1 Tax=Xenorhabdus hominickii TaxID=351679 RepID=A0A2G0PXG4_XENHO|nr:hypothetical protein [Xenorhabdus hominickii]PHM51649.1 hypothetical protein Xhom_04847 [Xenorhabdus hominickii]
MEKQNSFDCPSTLMPFFLFVTYKVRGGIDKYWFMRPETRPYGNAGSVHFFDHPAKPFSP